MKPGTIAVLFPLCLLVLAGAVAQPQTPPPAVPPHGAIPRATGEIRVDGRLDEAAWSGALAIELPFEISPAENAPAPVRTICLLLYDDARLYVGFRALDPDPSRVRAHVADRDGVFRNDYVGVVLDPFHDGRRGFEFMVNPLGVQMDAASSDVGGTSNGMASVSGAPAEDFSWDAIWSAAGRLTADGYAAEIAIPFSSLRFPRSADVQTWGIVAFRAWPRDVMHKLRSVPVDKDRNCYFCGAGTVGGLAGMKPGRNIELDPTVTFTRTDERPAFPDGDLANGRGERNVGLSARWGVTPNLSLNAALHPDFSQVEADVVELSVNRRFTPYYAEKRPFFQEGADFFATPFKAVYSRMVADPSWGAKLTGKDGANGLGAFLARDRETNLLFPSKNGSSTDVLDEANTTTVLRYRRDVGEASMIGALLTDRGAGDYRNRVYGIDSFLRLTPKDSVVFQALHSETRYPSSIVLADAQPDGTFGGNAVRVSYDHVERNWDWWAHGSSKTAGFRADAGFITRVDANEVDYGLGHTFWGGPGHWFNKQRLGLDLYHADDASGAFLMHGETLTWGYEGPLQSTVKVWLNRSSEQFGAREFTTNGVSTYFNFRPTGDFTSSIEVGYTKAIDYDNARPGYQLDIEPGITYNLGRHFYLQLDHQYERFTEDGGWLYRANVSALRLVYQFNVRLFVRAILQRTRVDSNARLYTAAVEATDTTLGGQYLVSYKLNPQTLFYVGYSDTRNGTDVRDQLLKDRTVFLKLGYAWVM